LETLRWTPSPNTTTLLQSRQETSGRRFHSLIKMTFPLVQELGDSRPLITRQTQVWTISPQTA
jgi:hypothetical protein